MTFREIMKRLSKLHQDQLDDEANVYVRDLDKYFEIVSFEISKKETEFLDEDQAYMVL